MGISLLQSHSPIVYESFRHFANFYHAFVLLYNRLTDRMAKTTHLRFPDFKFLSTLMILCNIINFLIIINNIIKHTIFIGYYYYY